jgi:hypothetical protein
MKGLCVMPMIVTSLAMGYLLFAIVIVFNTEDLSL